MLLHYAKTLKNLINTIKLVLSEVIIVCIVTVHNFNSNAKPNRMLLIHGFHKNLLYSISAFHFQSFPPSTELPPRKIETVNPGSSRTTFYVPKMNLCKSNSQKWKSCYYKFFKAKQGKKEARLVERNWTMSLIHLQLSLCSSPLPTAFPRHGIHSCKKPSRPWILTTQLHS